MEWLFLFIGFSLRQQTWRVSRPKEEIQWEFVKVKEWSYSVAHPSTLEVRWLFVLYQYTFYTSVINQWFSDGVLKTFHNQTSEKQIIHLLLLFVGWDLWILLNQCECLTDQKWYGHNSNKQNNYINVVSLNLFGFPWSRLMNVFFCGWINMEITQRKIRLSSFIGIFFLPFFILYLVSCSRTCK